MKWEQNKVCKKKLFLIFKIPLTYFLHVTKKIPENFTTYLQFISKKTDMIKNHSYCVSTYFCLTNFFLFSHFFFISWWNFKIFLELFLYGRDLKKIVLYTIITYLKIFFPQDLEWLIIRFKRIVVNNNQLIRLITFCISIAIKRNISFCLLNTIFS